MKQINETELDRVGGGVQLPGETQPYNPDPFGPFQGWPLPLPLPGPTPFPGPQPEWA
ncbi:MAG: hypothetical protein ABI411_10750 [Tahibacter sp.]